jgi:hypothetical protein
MMGNKPSTGSQASPTSYPIEKWLYGAVVLAVLAGILHIYIGVVIFGIPQGIVLVLIALVYFVGAGLVAANYKRDLWLGIALGWVILVIVLWALSAAVNVAGTRDPLSFLEKALEVILLVLLIRLRTVRLTALKPVTK